MPRFGLGRKDIARLERERDVESIIAFLRDDDDKVVFQAIEALTRIGENRGIEALMALVADASTRDIVRAKAWLALDVGIAREAKKRTDWT
ncbi:MAG: HEAT repeat domain-containing protein [Actinomycetota bacterium]|nr:HEAT repeat domain-containing protein [Actinomycetota bacterium]